MIIVYVGAIIVLIGYVCAVSPNLSLEPDYRLLFFFLLLLLFFILFNFCVVFSLDTVSNTLVDYYYSFQGLLTFLVLVFILFITLLIVTSSYFITGGPFRSVSI